MIPNKSHDWKNKPNNKALKPSQPTLTLHNDKETNSNWKKTERHYKFCDKDGHTKPKLLKNMEASKSTTKKIKICLDTSSSPYSQHAISAYIYSFSASTFSSNERLIDCWEPYHIAHDKAIFSSLVKWSYY